MGNGQYLSQRVQKQLGFVLSCCISNDVVNHLWTDTSRWGFSIQVGFECTGEESVYIQVRFQCTVLCSALPVLGPWSYMAIFLRTSPSRDHSANLGKLFVLLLNIWIPHGCAFVFFSLNRNRCCGCFFTLIITSDAYVYVFSVWLWHYLQSCSAGHHRWWHQEKFHGGQYS